MFAGIDSKPQERGTIARILMYAEITRVAAQAAERIVPASHFVPWDSPNAIRLWVGAGVAQNGAGDARENILNRCF